MRIYKLEYYNVSKEPKTMYVTLKGMGWKVSVSRLYDYSFKKRHWMVQFRDDTLN